MIGKYSVYLTMFTLACLFAEPINAQCGGAASACSGRVLRTPLRTGVGLLLERKPIRSGLRAIFTRSASCSGAAAACSGAAATCSSEAAPAPAPVAVAPTPETRLVSVSAPVSVPDSDYQQALASARYRASRGIHGHSYLDTHRTSGVGWASHDPTPTTCLGEGGCYAVVRGVDGWYATKFR